MPRSRHGPRTLLILVVLLGSVAVPAAASHSTDQEPCSFPVTETDQTGNDVTLDEPAAEVVVLDAASAQVFWEIGAEDRIVGMPIEEYTAYLNGSTTRTDVTDGQRILVELVIELDPDLVIAPNFADETAIAQLRQAGVTVYQLPLEDSIVAIYTKTAIYGHFVGECKAANQTVAEMQRDIEAITTAVRDRQRPRVLYYFFGFTAGDGTFIHDLIELAGGSNIAANEGIDGYQEISDEVVVEADPEWIVSPSHAALHDGEPFASTTAMQSNQTLVVDENLVSQAAPRVVIPLRSMAEAFHPPPFEANTESPMESPQSQPLRPVTTIGIIIAGLIIASYVLFRRRP